MGIYIRVCFLNSLSNYQAAKLSPRFNAKEKRKVFSSGLLMSDVLKRYETSI